MANTPIFICAPNSKGCLFRLERTRRQWRQLDVAKQAGISQSYVSKAERDLYIPRWVLERLQEILLVEQIND